MPPVHTRAGVRQVVVDEHVIQQRGVTLPLVPFKRRLCVCVCVCTRARLSALPWRALWCVFSLMFVRCGYARASQCMWREYSREPTGPRVTRASVRNTCAETGRAHVSMLRGAATSAPELAVSPSIAMALPPMAESFFLVSDSSPLEGDQKDCNPD